MLAEQDPTPLLRLYGDGRARVHYPVYMKRAGDYELQLSTDEMRNLLADLEGEGLPTLDVAGGELLRRGAVAEEESRGELFHVSDTSETVIRMLVAQPGGRAAPRRTTIRWSNVSSDAKRFPDLDAVQVIARCEERLRELTERDDLIPLP